ncbi:hypothetical protein M3Y95_00671600 [Aphelenchoides besseyi]|nr:hypothetical protein M3Y95_00671600 [Aphelenchoides besseyi]
MAGTVADDRDPNEKTYPCRTCGRHFIKSSLVKHEPACKKITKMQRKVFDSGKQRSNNSDIPYKAIKKAAQEKEKLGGVFPRPKTHWRERHQEFIGAVAASKQVEHALKTGKPLPPPPRTSVPSDYVRCDYCGRNFNQTAAERHIPFCKEQHGRRGTTIQQRSNSVGRVPTTKSLRSQSRSGSSRTQSREHSPNGRSGASRQQPRTPAAKSPASRRSVRQPTGSKAPPTSNGAAARSGNVSSAVGQRASGLPTPVKRSRSAPRNPMSRGGSTAAAKSPRTKTPKTPKSRSKSRSGAQQPKTPSGKPKTPKRPKSRSPAPLRHLISSGAISGFALAAPLSQHSKRKDKSPVRNGTAKRIGTTGSIKRR